MHWSNERIIELIELYRDKNLLWNPKCKAYRNKTIRREALGEITRKLNVPSEEIERKLHSLRTQFQRECKKKDKPSSWFAFEHLKFLLSVQNFARIPYKFQNLEKKEETLSEDEPPPLTQITEYETPVATAKQYIEYHPVSYRRDDNDSESLISQKISPPKKRCIESPVAQSLSINQSTSGEQQHSPPILISSVKETVIDHLETFGKYVAEELRNINHDTYAIQVAKHRINQVLFDATTGAFRRT